MADKYISKEDSMFDFYRLQAQQSLFRDWIRPIFRSSHHTESTFFIAVSIYVSGIWSSKIAVLDVLVNTVVFGLTIWWREFGGDQALDEVGIEKSMEFWSGYWGYLRRHAWFLIYMSLLSGFEKIIAYTFDMSRHSWICVAMVTTSIVVLISLIRQSPEVASAFGSSVFATLAVNLQKIWMVNRKTNWIWMRILTIAVQRVKTALPIRQQKPIPDHLRYRHDKIKSDQFRLLIIHRFIPFRRLRCTVITATLQEKPIYEAISYTWGTSTDATLINVNGKALRISTTTYTALHDRSSYWTSRVLWIDQICIDQSNLEEKAIQVSMMEKIYQSADQVTVCLGNPPLAGFAIAMLKELAMMTENGVSAEDLVSLCRMGQHLPTWRGLLEFLNHPWFTRIWVVQEIAVAQKVVIVYGQFLLDWDTVVKSLFMFGTDRSCMSLIIGLPQGKGAIQSLSAIIEIDGLRTNRRSLSSDPFIKTLLEFTSVWSVPSTLVRTIQRQATDPRDKIFAVQNLGLDKDGLKIPPDYTMSVRDLYLRMGLNIMFEFREPFFAMGYAGIAKGKSPGLPSWAVDWSRGLDRSVLTTPTDGEIFDQLAYFVALIQTPERAHEYKPNDQRYKASGDLKVRVHRHPSVPETALIGGLLVDEVAQLGRQNQPETMSYEDVYLDRNRLGFHKSNCISSYEWLVEARQMVFGDCEDEETLDALEDIFWRVLIGDRILLHRPAPASMRDDYRSWNIILETNRGILELIKQGQSPDMPGEDWYYKALEGSTRYINALGHCAAGKRFCITARSLMGCVPLDTEVGDLVFIAAGARVPWIIRKIDSTREEFQVSEDKRTINTEGEYIFVGECYIDGMMDGAEMNGVVDGYGSESEDVAEEQEMGETGAEEQEVNESQNQEQGNVAPLQPALDLQWIRLS